MALLILSVIMKKLHKPTHRLTGSPKQIYSFPGIDPTMGFQHQSELAVWYRATGCGKPRRQCCRIFKLLFAFIVDTDQVRRRDVMAAGWCHFRPDWLSI